ARLDEGPADQLRLGQLQRLLDPLSRGAPFSVELARDCAPDCAPDTFFGRACVVAVAAQSESGHRTTIPARNHPNNGARRCVPVRVTPGAERVSTGPSPSSPSGGGARSLHAARASHTSRVQLAATPRGCGMGEARPGRDDRLTA